MKFRITKKDLLMLMTCLLLVNIPYLSQTTNNVFALVLEIILVFGYRSIEKRFIRDNIPIVIFAVSVVFCTFINHGISTRTATAIVTVIRYILLFFSGYYFSKYYSENIMITLFKRFLLVIVALTDLSIIVTLLTIGVSEQGGAGNIYLIGNKFTVSYYHMFCLALFQIDSTKKKRHEKGKLIIFALFCIGVCYTIECYTGIVGCLIVIGVRLLCSKKNAFAKLMSKPLFFCSFLIGANLIFIGTDFLLKDSVVTDLLRKFSHTGKILTGRYDMYMIALNEFRKSSLIGYGINCTIVEDLLTWGNAQNGLLKLMLDYGILGTVSFILLCFHSLKQKKNCVGDAPIKFGLLSFLYGMLICSLVEINLNSLFFMALSLYLYMGKRNTSVIIDGTETNLNCCKRTILATSSTNDRCNYSQGRLYIRDVGL